MGAQVPHFCTQFSPKRYLGLHKAGQELDFRQGLVWMGGDPDSLIRGRGPPVCCLVPPLGPGVPPPTLRSTHKLGPVGSDVSGRLGVSWLPEKTGSQ